VVGRIFCAFLLAGTLTVGAASAQSWPTRTITAVIPFPPGSASDITARVVLKQVSKQLAQTIVIENRGGAGGTIGVGQVARANPDGYTILFHSASFAAAHVTCKTLPYNTLKDFIAVSAVGLSPSVLVAARSKKYKTATALIAAATEELAELNYRGISYASAGIGASYLAAEKFRVAAGIVVQRIPFESPVDALAGVVHGNVDYYFLPLAPALHNIRSGKVVALAVSSEKRAPTLPDVPTVGEIGLPTAVHHFWNGIFAPAKTPRPIVDRLHEETQKAVAEVAVKERLAKLGVEPLMMSQPDFERYFRADVLDAEKLAQRAGIRKQ
jgi:tripartite-type tricarboxylate transporter receptor subunit TctC